MSGVPIDLAAARFALGAAAARAEVLIASMGDSTLPARGLDWTLGETAAHLVADIRRFLDMVLGRVVPEGGVERVAAVNAAHLDEVVERDPAALARLFSAAVRDFLIRTREHAGSDPVGWYGGHQINVAATTCLVLGEVIVHGHDMARTTGTPWSIDRHEANLVLDGATWTLPSMVDPEGSRGVRATYEVRVRGGSRVVVRFHDGALTVEPGKQPGVDCHISADPVALLLVGYGRSGQWGEIARGKLVAWGRKPWLGPKFVAMLRRP